MAGAEHGAKSMDGEADCDGRPVCFCVLACVLASLTYFPFTAIFCVVPRNLNTRMCVLSNLKPSCRVVPVTWARKNGSCTCNVSVGKPPQ